MKHLFYNFYGYLDFEIHFISISQGASQLWTEIICVWSKGQLWIFGSRKYLFTSAIVWVFYIRSRKAENTSLFFSHILFKSISFPAPNPSTTSYTDTASVFFLLNHGYLGWLFRMLTLIVYYTSGTFSCQNEYFLSKTCFHLLRQQIYNLLYKRKSFVFVKLKTLLFVCFFSWNLTKNRN